MDKEIERKENEKRLLLSPSILSVPLAKLKTQLQEIEDLVDFIHIDVMDGKFVTNQTDGTTMFLEAYRAVHVPLDVHLMVENPLLEIPKYEKAKMITFHIEALKEKRDRAKHIAELKHQIKKQKAMVGVSIKPGTNVKEIVPFLKDVDLVLVMTVEPGYGGQKFQVEQLEKVKELRKYGFDGWIEVDGGVNLDNLPMIRESGVDIVVAGTSIFSAKDKRWQIEQFRCC